MKNNKVNILIALLLSFAFLTGCKSDPIEVRDKYHASAQEYFNNGQYEEAMIEFRNALRADKGHIPSYLGIGKAYQQIGDHQNAIAIFQQVINLDGKNVEARLRIGEYQIAVGISNPKTFKQAQETAEEILKLDPSNVDALIILGNAYAGQNEVDKAIQEYNYAIDLDPINLKAMLNLSAAHLRKNNIQQAESLFKKALENHPEDIQAHLALAGFYSSTKRPRDTETYLLKAFDLAPADSRSLYSLANFYLTQKKTSEAENVFKEAISRKPKEREPRWGLAQFYLQQGEIDTEIETLNELLRSFPDDDAAKLRLAMISLSREDETKAEEYTRSVLKSNDTNAQAHYMLGTILRKRQDFDKALEEFESAIKLNASLAPAYLEKANLLLMRGDLDECENTLQTILQLNKNYLPARGALAKLLVIRQNPRDALQQAQEVLEAMPNNEDALGARAEALRLLDRLDESKKDWIKLSEMQPQNAAYWYHLGAVEAVKKEDRSALTHFRKAVELKPDFINAINDIVYIHLKKKQYDTALSELDRLDNEKSPQDEIHRFRGQVYLANDDHSSAENEWRKAIELNPQNYRTYLLLGQLYQKQNRIPEAIRELDQLIAQNDKHTLAYLQKAYYLQVDNDFQGAIENYRKVLELDSQNIIAANNLAWLLTDNEINLEEALSLAQKAKKKHPEDPEIADTLGWTYYKMKNYTLAENQLLFSVNNRKQPTAEHYYRLGMALYKKGNRLQAKQTLQKSLDLNAEFDGADEAHRILETIK